MGQGKKRARGATAPSGPADVVPFPPAAPPAAGPVVSPGRRALFLSIPFVVFFTLLAAVEWGVRLTRPHVSTLETFVLAPEQHRGFRDLHQVSVFEGDPLLFWRVAPNLKHVIWDFTPVTTNAQGLRYPKPVGRKPRGTFRVACFGDSITFGYRVPTVWPERPQDYDRGALPYPDLLEAGLREANPGRDIEVIPMAVPGFSSHQGRAWVGRDVGWLEPDVLIAAYGWNDINARARTDRETMSVASGQVFLRRLMTRSQALIHASRAWHSPRAAAAPSGPAAPTVRVTAEEYVDNLREIARAGGRAGARVIVLGPIFRDTVTEPDEATRIRGHRERLGQAMTADGVPYLEIPELQEAAWPGNERLFGERIHPSFLGHRLMANRLAEKMAAEGMLKDLRPPRTFPVS